MEQAHAQLVLFARVRAELRRLANDGLLDPALAESAERSLTDSERRLLEDLPHVDTETLIAECLAANLGAEVQVLRSASRAARLRGLLERREAVLPTGMVDLSDLHPALTRVPVAPFGWNDLDHRWHTLAAAITDERVGVDSLRAASEAFFDSRHNVALPVRTGLPLHGLVADLIKHRILPSADAPSCADDLARITEALEFASGQMLVEFSISGELPERVVAGTSHALFEVLETHAGMESPDTDLTPLLMRWSGPFFGELADAWLARRPGEDEAVFIRRADLLVARTGVDPYGEPTRWRRWAEAHGDSDQARLSALREAMHADRLLFTLALAMSAGSVLEDAVERRWWPLVQNLRARRNPKAAPRPETAAPPAAVDIAQAALATAAAVDAVTPEQHGSPPRDRRDAGDAEAWVPELDIEFTAAPDARRSDTDEFVEERSAWSIYLRPFLSENWLGLVGITSLMAAWMFLTMWLWDKGQVYRIAMGAVPLLGLTIGAAWIARFIQRLPDGAPRAVTLFAALAYLSVPFNFALGASLLTVPATSAKLAAFASIVVYAALTPWISHRIAGGLGFAPARPLLELNLLAYVPGLLVLGFGPEALPIALGAVLFAGWVNVWRALCRQNADGTFPPALAFWLQCGSLVLVVAIPHVYFRVWPEPLAIAVLAQFIGLGLAYAFALPAVVLIGTAALSLVGVLLGLLNPTLLPIVLGLATVFWFLQFRRDAWEHAHEATAVHGFGLAVAAAFSLGWPWLAGPLALVAMFCSRRLEQHRDSEFLHFGYPIVMALCAWSAISEGAGIASLSGVIATLTVLAAAAWGHWRFSTRFRVNLYFVNIAATSAALIATIGLTDLHWSTESMAGIASVAALLTALWCLVTIWLRDPLTVVHRSVIQAVLGTVGLGLWVAAATTTPLAGSWLPFAALVLAAASVELARRTRSVIPMAAGLAIAGIAAARLKAEFGLGSSGLGTAIVAVAMLALAEWLRRRAELESRLGGRDQWFGRSWPWRSDRYFALPLEVAAGLTALAGIAQALPRLGPLFDRPAVAIGVALCAIVIGRLAWISASSWLGVLALPGLLAFSAALLNSGPTAYLLHGIALWILALHEVVHRLPDTDARFVAGVTKPLRWLLTTACWLFAPGALLSYPWLLISQADPLTALLWAALVLIVHARCIVPRWPAGLSHLVHLHILVIVFGVPYVSLGYPDGLTALSYAPLVVGAAFVVLTGIAWLAPIRDWTRPYARSAWPWVTALAVVFALVGIYLTLWGPLHVALPKLSLPIAAWLMFEVTAHRWRGGIMEMPRLLVVLWFWALFWLASAISVVIDTQSVIGFAWPGLVVALICTALTYWLLEDLARRLETMLGRGLLGRPRAHGDHPGQRVAVITLLTFAVALAMVAHFVVTWPLAAQTSVSSHLWLYPLIAALIWAARDVNSAGLAWFGVGVFAYANCFIALEFTGRVAAHGMTALHLLAGAFVVTLFILVAAGQGLRRGSGTGEAVA